MRFTKMHGAGNDFIIIDTIRQTLPDRPFGELAAELCRAHTSVGADGLMLVRPAQRGGDIAMLFFNSDGSMGEMCGNGARCICRWAYEHGYSGSIQHVETTAGIVTGRRLDASTYRVRLNDPSVLELDKTVTADGRQIRCSYTELGDPGIPHAVVLMAGWEAMPREDLKKLGRALRYCPAFPKGANVTFAELTSSDTVNASTYERGVEDFTLACGTGCGSTALALSRLGLVSPESVSIRMPGGELSVAVTAEGIFLSGPTCTVFEGEL